MNARPLVALLESRMSRELARLVEKHGGEPVCVPAMRECPELANDSARRLLEEIENDRHEVVVFMTGVAVSLLFEVAEQQGRRANLVAALRRPNHSSAALLTSRKVPDTHAHCSRLLGRT